MGLDQFWHVEGESEEFYYHRKVPALEAFMSAKWKSIPGNEDGVFNCEKLIVTEEILNGIEKSNIKTID